MTASTIVDAAHGSYLSCHRRLGCTDADHAARRRDYNRAASERSARRAGVPPKKRGRTHGTRSAYRVCTDGPDGHACQECRDAEARYAARYRAAVGKIARPGRLGGRFA